MKRRNIAPLNSDDKYMALRVRICGMSLAEVLHNEYFAEKCELCKQITL